MHPFSHKTVLSTKEASDLSGYSADYLSKLTRAGKIQGKRAGRSWVIDKESLDVFLSEQAYKKAARARALAQERERERERGAIVSGETLPVARMLTTQLPMPSFGLSATPLRVHIGALSLALAIVASGSFIASSGIVNSFGVRMLSLANETATGFYSEFTDVPNRIVDNAITARGRLFEGIVESPPSEVRQASVMQVGTYVAQYDPGAVLDGGYQSVATVALSYPVTEGSYPEKQGNTINFENKISKHVTFSGVVNGIVHTIKEIPRTTYDGVIGLGNAVIYLAHTAISAEVSIVYASVKVAPVVSQKTFFALEVTGQTLAEYTARTPEASKRGFIALTTLPSKVGPLTASTIWRVEYRAAEGFVAVANSLMGGYLHSVGVIGTLAYMGTHQILVVGTQGMQYASVATGFFGQKMTHK